MKAVLNNNGPCDDCFGISLYYPRLQVNQLGEIILATSKRDTLSTGILVGKTPGSKSRCPLGKKFDDWEVVGPLTDYDGDVTVTLTNKVKMR